MNFKTSFTVKINYVVSSAVHLIIPSITFRLVSKDFPDISIGIKQYVEKYLCEPNYENGCKLVERYNQTVKTYIKLNRGTEEYCAKCRRACDKNLADHILRQVRLKSLERQRSTTGHVRRIPGDELENCPLRVYRL